MQEHLKQELLKLSNQPKKMNSRIKTNQSWESFNPYEENEQQQ